MKDQAKSVEIVQNRFTKIVKYVNQSQICTRKKTKKQKVQFFLQFSSVFGGRRLRVGLG